MNNLEFVKKILAKGRNHLERASENRYSDDTREAEKLFQELDIEVTNKAHEHALSGVNYSTSARSLYEDKIERRGNAIAHKLANDELSLLAQIKQAIVSVKDQFSQSKPGKIVQEIEEIDSGFKNAKVLAGRDDGETDGNRYLVLNPIIAIVVLLFFGICEVPINSTLFELFKLSGYKLYLTLMLLVILIPAAVHGMGFLYKRWKDGGVNKVFAVLLSVFLFAFAFSMAYLRFVFFSARDILNQNVVDGIVSTLVELMKDLTLSDALGSSEFWTTLILNFIIILIGAILGYFTHDSNRAFEEYYRKYYKTKSKKIAELEEVRQTESKRMEIGSGGGEYGLYMDMLEELKSIFVGISSEVKSFYGNIDNKTKESILLYRTEFSSKANGNAGFSDALKVSSHAPVVIMPELPKV